MNADQIKLNKPRVLFSQHGTRVRAFTLIELMAVVVVILVLAAIGLGVAGYVQKKVAVATTKSQIAAIEAALESYKSDWGYYPPTSSIRIDTGGGSEQTNNAILYRALFCQGKQYLTFPAAQMYAELSRKYVGVTFTNIYDVFGRPFNYYCSPSTPLAYSTAIAHVSVYGNEINQLSSGGQVNLTSYDLFSYGPDKITFYGFTSAPVVSPLSGKSFPWNLTNSAMDDITNWKQ